MCNAVIAGGSRMVESARKWLVWFQPNFWKEPSSHLPALCSSCRAHACPQTPKGGRLPPSEGGDIFLGCQRDQDLGNTARGNS